MEVDPTPELDPITLRTPWGGRPNHLNPYAWRAAAAAAAATATVAEAATNRKRKRQVAPSSHPGQSSGAGRPGAGQVLGPTFRPLPHFHADSEEHTSDTSTSPWKRPTTAAQLKRRRRHWQPHAAGQSPTAVEMATDPDQSRVPPAVLAACHHEQLGELGTASRVLDMALGSSDPSDCGGWIATAAQTEEAGAPNVACAIVTWLMRAHFDQSYAHVQDLIDVALGYSQHGHRLCSRAILAELHCAAPHSEYLRHISTAAAAAGEASPPPSPPAVFGPRAGELDAGSVIRGLLLSAAIDWQTALTASAERTLEAGLQAHPHAPKLWAALGMLREQTQQTTDGVGPATQTYCIGLAQCPGSRTLRRLALRAAAAPSAASSVASASAAGCPF